MPSFGEQGTKLLIANIALAKIQQTQLTADEYIRGEGIYNTNAELVNAILPNVIEACLSFRPWAFATKRAKLEPVMKPDGEDPPGPVDPVTLGYIGYERKFKRPDDCIFIQDIYTEKGVSLEDRYRWEICESLGTGAPPVTRDYHPEGGAIYGPADATWCKYTYLDITPAAISRWPAGFRLGAVYKLAGELAPRLGRDGKALEAMSEIELAKAARLEAKQDGLRSAR